MKFTVRLLPSARSDLRRLGRFLAEKSPTSALRAADILDKALRALADFPERAPVNDVGGRDLFVPFGAAAYVIRYRIEAMSVVVTHIFHTREDRSA